ncbi:unnamed protein product, partial [Symbiodinium sp. KB8]
YLQWRCRMKHFAGIACGIVKNGSLVFYQDAGYQDAEQKVKMSGDTIVRLFSMTKAYALSPEFVAVDSFTVQGRSKGPWGNSAPGALNHNGPS